MTRLPTHAVLRSKQAAHVPITMLFKLYTSCEYLKYMSEGLKNRTSLETAETSTPYNEHTYRFRKVLAHLFKHVLPSNQDGTKTSDFTFLSVF